MLVKKFIVQGKQGILNPNCSLEKREKRAFSLATKKYDLESVGNKKPVKKFAESFMNQEISPIKEPLDQRMSQPKPIFDADEGYYKKRAEFINYNKKALKMNEDFQDKNSIQYRKVAGNRRNAPCKVRKTPTENRHNKTAVLGGNDEEDINNKSGMQKNIGDPDLSFDVYAERTNISNKQNPNPNKGHPTSLALAEYELTAPMHKKVNKVGPLQFKPVRGESADRQKPRVSTSIGMRVIDHSNSPHNNAKTETESRFSGRLSVKPMKKGNEESKLTDPVIVKYPIKLNQTAVEKRVEKSEPPITIIQTPQINNINNYNSISINTIAIGQPVSVPPNPAAPPLSITPNVPAIPHPPPPPQNPGSKVNQFRMRKYRLGGVDALNSPKK